MRESRLRIFWKNWFRTESDEDSDTKLANHMNWWFWLSSEDLMNPPPESDDHINVRWWKTTDSFLIRLPTTTRGIRTSTSGLALNLGQR